MTTPYLTKRWEKYWTPRLNKYKTKKSNASNKSSIEPPSIVASLLDMHKWEILYGGVLKLFSDTMQFANPFLLQ